MKKLFFVLMISVLFAGSLLYAGVPHPVGGMVYYVDGVTEPQPDVFDFDCYITSRPDEVRHVGDLGNWYYLGWGFSNECGNFPTNWYAGDILHFDIKINGVIYGDGEIVLNNEAFQNMPDPIILPIEPPMPLNPPRNLMADVMDNDVYLSWLAPSTGGSMILVVDDDGSAYLDFADTQPYYTAFLDEISAEYEIYDILEDAADGPDSDYMSAYDLVIWECGEQWALDRTINDNDEANLGTYLDGGGKLIVSAHDYLWDQYPSAGAFSAGQFPYDYLGIASVTQDAYTVSGEQVAIVGAGYTDSYQVGLVDIFTARDGVYLDYFVPNAMGSAYSTYSGNIVGVQTANTIFTTAGFAGLVDDVNTVAEYVGASIDFGGTRDLTGYNVYRDDVMIASTGVAELTYDDMDLDPGTYIYELSATYDDGESPRTDPAEAIILGMGTIEGMVTDGITGDPLEGATVTAGEYMATTMADGSYTMDVQEGTYDVMCEFLPYGSETMYDVVVGDGATVVVDFELYDEVFPPNSVEAVENAGYVDLTWNEPGGGVETEFRHDDGVITGQLGFGGGNTTAMLGGAHAHHAILNDVSWYSTAEGGPHTSVNIVILGLDGTGTPDVNDILYEAYGLPGVDDQWNVHTLPEAVEAENGFFLGYNFAGFAGLGTDDGVGEPYVYTVGEQFITADWTAGNAWETPDIYGFSLNFAIRANGLDLGEIEFRDDFALTPQKILNPDFHAGSPIEPRNAGKPKYSINPASTTSRDLEGYEVYRLIDGQQGTPGEWTLLDDTVTETMYTDMTWPPAEAGLYVWGVTAAYTGGNVSDAAFSNIIDYGMTAEVTVNVTTNSGDDAMGADVLLVNQDGNPDHVYEAMAPAGGTVVFPAVWFGTYDVEVSLGGYDSYAGVHDITGDYEFGVELGEILVPPCGLHVEYEGQNVTLDWQLPGSCAGLEEDFEAGVLPEGWMMTTNSAQGWFFTQDGSSTYWAIPPHTTYACSNDDMADDDGSVDYLITPPQDLSFLSAISITFQSFYTSAYGQLASVEVSEDGGASWSVVEDLSPGTGAWDEVTVDLSDYCGAGHTDVLIGFHSDDAGAWADGWAIDDVVLGGTGSRELLGYNVYRNEDTTPLNTTPITALTYNDPNAPIGTYRYDVTAVYTTGESESIFWLGNVETGEFEIPVATGLGINFPNPFNPVTKINFAIHKTSEVSIKVYNARGEKVKTLVSDSKDPGNHSVVWYGKDDSGKDVASGVYFYKMKAGRYTSTKKMILMK